MHSGDREHQVKIRDEVRTEPDAEVSVQPLSTERGEVKPASPRGSGSLVCLPGSFLGKRFFLRGSCSFFDSGPPQLLCLP